jgi:Protein of unknown function (DUF3617)
MNFVRAYMVLMLFLAGAAAAAYAADATIDVTPGKYSIKKETSSSLQPDPVVKTEERCITDAVFNPVEALPSKENCSAKNVKKTGNTVTFDIECKGGPQMPPLNGKAEYSSNGVGIAWNIVMQGEADGKGFTITSKAEGRRVGSCQ